jgi:hypothetical protein
MTNLVTTSFDISAQPNESLLSRCFARVMRALHDSREMHAAHVIDRYRHLMAPSATHASDTDASRG